MSCCGSCKSVLLHRRVAEEDGTTMTAATATATVIAVTEETTGIGDVTVIETVIATAVTSAIVTERGVIVIGIETGEETGTGVLPCVR